VIEHAVAEQHRHAGGIAPLVHAQAHAAALDAGAALRSHGAGMLGGLHGTEGIAAAADTLL
jgi:hypothetical protein